MTASTRAGVSWVLTPAGSSVPLCPRRWTNHLRSLRSYERLKRFHSAKAENHSCHAYPTTVILRAVRRPRALTVDTNWFERNSHAHHSYVYSATLTPTSPPLKPGDPCRKPPGSG